MGRKSAAPLLPKRKPFGSWYRHLLRECALESQRTMLPAFARPSPASWVDYKLTAAWLGHATVLINFFGFVIIKDQRCSHALAFDCRASRSARSG